MDNSVDFSGNNIFYDFLNLDISGTMALDPSFIDLYFMPGISGYDSIANLDIFVNNFNNLFFVNLKLQDLSDNSFNDMKFAMDPSGWNNNTAVPFSSATVESSSAVNTEVISSKQQIKYDLVRFFLNEITGTNKLNSLIRNKTELINSVVSIDASFQTNIKNIISSVGGTFQSPLDNSTMNPGSILLNSILGEDDQGVDNYNDTRKNTLISYFNTKANELYQSSKGNKYYFFGNTMDGLGWYYPLYIDPSHVDLSGVAYHSLQFDNNGRIFYMPDASTNNAVNPKPTFNGTYTDYYVVDNSFIPIPFYDGDKLAVKLTYYPKRNTISGNNIGNRSYKVILNLKNTNVVTQVISPINFTFTYTQLGSSPTNPLGGFIDISSNIYAIKSDSLTKWDGTTWTNIPGTTSVGTVNFIINNGNDIYVSGSFSSIGGIGGTNKIAKWDGTTWSSVVSSITALNITCILFDGNDMYISGTNFTNINGVTVNGIAKWNGTTWSQLGLGITGSNISVYTIKKYNNHIYIGGNFNSVAGVNGTKYIAKWDGASWSSVGTSLTNVTNIYRIEFNGSDLYASSSGASGLYILKLNGITWTTIATTLASTFIETFVFDGQNMYIGGLFTSINGVSVNNIAKWNGTSISTCGNGFNNTVNKLKIINQKLYACGQYTSSGGNTNIKQFTQIS